MIEQDLKFLERRRALQPAMLVISALCIVTAFAWSAIVASKFDALTRLIAPDESFQSWEKLETTTPLEGKMKRVVISGLHVGRSLAASLGGWVALSGFVVFALLGAMFLRAYFIHRRYLRMFP